jgi:heptaprenyl diphosphate synthase
VTGASVSAAPPRLERLPAGALERVRDGLDDEPVLLDAVDYLLATSGKQLRPAICLDAARFGPEPESGAVLTCATAIELFHMGSLAHDDIVDDGVERRGITSLGARSGPSIAGLAASWTLGRAFELVTEVGGAVMADFIRAADELIEGQMMDAEDLFDVARTRTRYLEAIAGKTASLFWLAAALGARASGAPEPVVASLTEFGRNLGMTFQLSDDILDLVGSKEALGKPPGSDLREGLCTLPVIYAIEARPELARAVAKAPEDERGAAEAIGGVVETGAIERARGDLAVYAERARTALAALGDGDAPAARRLLSVLDYSEARAAVEALR